MGITEVLEKYSRDIRDLAVTAEFKEEQFQVLGSDKDHAQSAGNGGGIERLTLDTYHKWKKFMNTKGDVKPEDFGLKYGTTRANYYVVKGDEVWKYKCEEMDVDTYGNAITWFGKSHPETMKSLIKVLEKLPNKLCARSDWQKAKGADRRLSDDGGVGDTDILLGHAISLMSSGLWKGATRNTYQSAFGGGDWEDIVHGDYLLTAILLHGAEAQQAVHLTTRESILNICKATLESLRGDGAGGMGPKGVAATIAIVGALVALSLSLTGTLAGLAAFSVAGAVVSAGNGIQSALVSANMVSPVTGASTKKEIKIGGATTREKLNSMMLHINDLSTASSGKESEIAGKLTAIHNAVLENGASRERFELVFPSGSEEMTDRDLRRSEFSTLPDVLEEAAVKEFPKAAGAMAAVNSGLAETGDVTTAFHSEWVGASVAKYPWESLRNLLQDMTGGNADKVGHAGAVMLRFARSVNATDETSATDLKTIEAEYDKIDPTFSGKDHEPILDDPEPPPGRPGVQA